MFILTTNIACLWITDAEIDAKVGQDQADACFVCDTASTQDSADTASPDSGSGDTDADSDSDTDVDSDTDTDSDTAGDTGIDTGASFVDYVTVYGSTMVAIPAGTFCMGCGKGDPDGAYIDHEVTLTHGFWIAQSETTSAEWAAWTSAAGNPNTAPSAYGGSGLPVEQVNWYETAQYANALSTAEGITPCYLASGSDLAPAYLSDPYSCPGYRLPTEAEWEYAARAGEDTEYAGSDDASSVAWTSGTEQAECSLVPNAWRLCDMSGNVWEWVNDWYEDDYYNLSPINDPSGPTSSEILSRSDRGGSAEYNVLGATVAHRDSNLPSARSRGLGFRLVRSDL